MRPLSAVLALFLVACVPRGTHELTEVQLDATRAALQERTAKCQLESQEAVDQINGLVREVAERDVALEACGVQSAALEEEVILYREELATVLAALPPVDLEDEDEEAPKPPPRSRRCPPCPEPPQPDPMELAHARGEMAAALALLSDHRVERRVVSAFAADVAARLAPLLEEGRIELEQRPNHVRVRIPSEQLFNEGRVTLSPRGKLVVEALVAGLAPARDWRIILVGHTDDVPRHSARYPSNWERGSGEALLLMRELRDAGVDADYRVGSAADKDPIDPGDTPEARRRNHRIEMQLRPPRSSFVIAPVPEAPEEPLETPEEPESEGSEE